LNHFAYNSNHKLMAMLDTGNVNYTVLNSVLHCVTPWLEDFIMKCIRVVFKMLFVYSLIIIILAY
jgi:hypothetical protein